MNVLAMVGDTRGDWVDAAPFRAQLRHQMATFALQADDVAAAAGIPARLAEHLLHGRNGRVLRRISPDTARRLLRMSDDQLRFLGRLRVPSGPARLQLHRLRRSGWDDFAIAERVGVSVPELERLASAATTCTQLLTLRLTAAAQAVDTARLPGWTWRSPQVAA